MDHSKRVNPFRCVPKISALTGPLQPVYVTENVLGVFGASGRGGEETCARLVSEYPAARGPGTGCNAIPTPSQVHPLPTHSMRRRPSVTPLWTEPPSSDRLDRPLLGPGRVSRPP